MVLVGMLVGLLALVLMLWYWWWVTGVVAAYLLLKQVRPRDLF